MTIESGFAPTPEQRQEILDWFARYDALVEAGELEAMADQALFPINEVSDDAVGHAAVVSCDREQFLAQMREQVGGAAVTTKAVRHPVFLDANLVFVVTDAEYTVDGQPVPMRYGDLLVRTAGGWRFQTMVAGGWG